MLSSPDRGNTGIAGRDGTELVDPAEKCIVCMSAIRSGEYGRQDAEQFIIPVPLAGGDGAGRPGLGGINGASAMGLPSRSNSRPSAHRRQERLQ
jgi:hypothetical protein